MSSNILVYILAALTMLSCGTDFDLTTHQLPITTIDRYPISIERVPMPPFQIWEKGCWLDDDCNDGLWCTGAEKCCGPRGSYTGWPGCVEGQCYNGVSPCGNPISAILPICDMEWDTCRGCQTDEECNRNTKYTQVQWNWCGGPRRCGEEGEGPSGHHQGVCLGTGEGFPCEWHEICDPEEQTCSPRPECRHDSDCPGFEAWCDENGKCHDQ